MAKQLPKTPKALSADYRKKIVLALTEALEDVWDEIPESELASHGILKLSDYLKQVEINTYEKRYALGSLEDYRNKIRSIKFNLKHNGIILFSKYSPDELVDVPPNELGAGWAGYVGSGEKKSNSDKDIYAPVCKILSEESKKEATRITASNAATAAGSGIRDSSEISGILEDYQKNIIPKVLGHVKIQSMILCRYCGPSAYVETFSKQTRSADEGETTFANCTKCKRKWRA